MLPLRRKLDKKFCRQEGKSNSRSRQQLAGSFKTQAQGRKDTPGRSKDSSSFKTQQTGQGRKPKVEFKVHSDLARRPNKNQWFTATRP
jgi:hypothetical protein